MNYQRRLREGGLTNGSIHYFYYSNRFAGQKIILNKFPPIAYITRIAMIANKSRPASCESWTVGYYVGSVGVLLR